MKRSGFERRRHLLPLGFAASLLMLAFASMHSHAVEIIKNVSVKLFFPALGTQNPTGTVPNWYFYWTDALSNGPHSFSAPVNFGRTIQDPGGGSFAVVEIGGNAYSSSGIPRHPTEKFIDAFGIIVNHEQWHRMHRNHNFSVHGGWAPPASDDIDGDHVCDREPTDPVGFHGGGFEAANGTDPANAFTFGGTIDREWIAQQNEPDPNAGAQDWAKPGTQNP